MCKVQQNLREKVPDYGNFELIADWTFLFDEYECELNEMMASTSIEGSKTEMKQVFAECNDENRFSLDLNKRPNASSRFKTLTQGELAPL